MRVPATESAVFSTQLQQLVRASQSQRSMPLHLAEPPPALPAELSVPTQQQPRNERPQMPRAALLQQQQAADSATPDGSMPELPAPLVPAEPDNSMQLAVSSPSPPSAILPALTTADFPVPAMLSTSAPQRDALAPVVMLATASSTQDKPAAVAVSPAMSSGTKLPEMGGDMPSKNRNSSLVLGPNFARSAHALAPPTEAYRIPAGESAALSAQAEPRIMQAAVLPGSATQPNSKAIQAPAAIDASMLGESAEHREQLVSVPLKLRHQQVEFMAGAAHPEQTGSEQPVAARPILPVSLSALTEPRAALSLEPPVAEPAATMRPGSRATETLPAMSEPLVKPEPETMPVSARPPLKTAVDTLAFEPKLSIPVFTERLELPVTKLPLEATPALTTRAYRASNSDSLSTISQAMDDWAQQIHRRVAWLANKQIPQASIQLDPPELGRLDIQVEIPSAKTVKVVLVAEHSLPREALENALPRLRETMSAAGFERLDVDIGQRGHSDAQRKAPAYPDMPASETAADDASAGDAPAEQIRAGNNPLQLVDYYA